MNINNKMNCEDEFGTFYKIKLFYNDNKEVEYHLSKKNNCYIYYKFIDNKFVYMTNEFRSNHIVKNIYHIIQNIEKLKEGKIKKYKISSQLELEILCDYLRKNNILHTIKIAGSRLRMVFNQNLSYDKYKEDFNTYRAYFGRDEQNYEKNKILHCFELYIQVYKGFVNLSQNSNVNTEIERPKFGVYMYFL